MRAYIPPPERAGHPAQQQETTDPYQSAHAIYGMLHAVASCTGDPPTATLTACRGDEIAVRRLRGCDVHVPC